MARAMGPQPLGDDGKELRGRAWFGSAIPGAEDAQAFFRRRGGPPYQWRNLVRQAGGAMPDWDEAVPFVDVPTLLVAAHDDMTKKYEATMELFDALPAQTKVMHTMQGGGHFGLFDTPLKEGDPSELPASHPEEAARAADAIASFVKSALCK